jgi:hypothetical protein
VFSWPGELHRRTACCVGRSVFGVRARAGRFASRCFQFSPVWFYASPMRLNSCIGSFASCSGPLSPTLRVFDCAFKLTADDGSRVNQSLPCGCGLTRRWAAAVDMS